MAKVGYVTATCDLTHEGHFRMLQAAKKRCSLLIVGLTTDETAKRQKRPPIFHYEHRESILTNCKWVDTVLPHNGEPKSEAWRRLRFDICFTCAEEYFDAEEFEELRQNCPNVEIIGLPRYPCVSTSHLLADIRLRVFLETKVIANGITGPVFHSGDLVLKTINFAAQDLLDITADNFGFFKFDMLPRNYKHIDGPQIEFPFIAGITAGRELMINQFFQSKPWSVFLRCEFPLFVTEESTSDALADCSLMQFALRVQFMRKYPTKSTCLIMRFGGSTLHNMLPKLTKSQLEDIKQKVLFAIEDIRSCGVLHGDIHPGNVLVDSNGYISIIDWGWCSAFFFKQSIQERNWLVARLAENFDRLHFLGSLQNDIKSYGLEL